MKKKISFKEINKTFLFEKKNYLLMLIGLFLISLGFIFMNGNDANTNLDGIYDKNYFNEDIFSFRRIRLAPIFIITGFIIQILAILLSGKSEH